MNIFVPIDPWEMKLPRKSQQYIQDFAEWGVEKTAIKEMKHWLDIGYATFNEVSPEDTLVGIADMVDIILTYLSEEELALLISVYSNKKEVRVDGSLTHLPIHRDGKVLDYELRRRGLIRIEFWYQDLEGHYTWAVHAPIGTVRGIKPLINRS